MAYWNHRQVKSTVRDVNNKKYIYTLLENLTDEAIANTMLLIFLPFPSI